ncbi:hypothetical protein [Bacillus sp. FSL M8-0168]|uniref:hypothetical protein n=1 Tax=Bacillus sp. FSL M8-0168 TaxID=2921614 RepID=UPI0030FDECC5
MNELLISQENMGEWKSRLKPISKEQRFILNTIQNASINEITVNVIAHDWEMHLWNKYHFVGFLLRQDWEYEYTTIYTSPVTYGVCFSFDNPIVRDWSEIEVYLPKADFLEIAKNKEKRCKEPEEFWGDLYKNVHPKNVFNFLSNF